MYFAIILSHIKGVFYYKVLLSFENLTLPQPHGGRGASHTTPRYKDMNKFENFTRHNFKIQYDDSSSEEF